MADAEFRPLAPEDVEHVKWALFEAVSWDPAREHREISLDDEGVRMVLDL